MLVGSDDVVREVHAAMVAWDGSAVLVYDSNPSPSPSPNPDPNPNPLPDPNQGGLSRLPELHAATNLTDEQRELLALAATEVRLLTLTLTLTLTLP